MSIVLWTVFNVLDEHLVEACEKYTKMGIAGWKIDFLDRNDQTAVEMAERLAKTCAQYKLFVDYHGFYTPTGMNRTYPNILNYEGVFGMEEARWAKKDTDMPRYDVTFPFKGELGGVLSESRIDGHSLSSAGLLRHPRFPLYNALRCTYELRT